MHPMKPAQALQKLGALGWSDRKIASQIGVSPNTVGRIRIADHKTNYDTGKAIVDLAHAVEVLKPKE